MCCMSCLQIKCLHSFQRGQSYLFAFLFFPVAYLNSVVYLCQVPLVCSGKEAVNYRHPLNKDRYSFSLKIISFTSLVAHGQGPYLRFLYCKADESLTSSGWDTNPSQVSSQQMLVYSFTYPVMMESCVSLGRKKVTQIFKFRQSRD